MNSVTSFAETDIDTVLRLAAIVEFSDDAILSKDLDGIITSWNAAASRLFGYGADEIIGKSVMLLIPPELADEEPEILARVRQGRPIEHYETVRVAKDGTRHDISLSVSPLRNIRGQVVGASTIARNITEKKRAERMLLRQQRRLEQIDRISKLIAGQLDLDRAAQTVIDIATQVSGARFGAFIYDLRDGENCDLLCALSHPARGDAGDFATYSKASLVDSSFKLDGVVRCDDVRAGFSPAWHFPGLPQGHPSVVSYLAIPITGHEKEILGGLFFAHEAAGRFTRETEEDIAAIVSHAAIAINNARLHRAAQQEIARRRKAEEAMELMLHEIRHRVKNSLGIVQAVVNQTFRDASPEQRRAFGARLQALSQAHDLLTLHRWRRACVREVVDHAIEPFQDRDGGRIAASGPAVELDANNALLLAMALHELGTNAVKYGALSKPEGRVTLAWAPSADDTQRLRLTWREQGGPPVSQPAHRGFGSTLIEKALRADGGDAAMLFAPAGLVCELHVPLR